jgi:shikimate dehydrogenase
MHEAEAAHHGLRLHYQLIDLDACGATVDDLPTLIKAARTMGFAGLNITYPCKQAVLPLLDELSPGGASDGCGQHGGQPRRTPDRATTPTGRVGAGVSRARCRMPIWAASCCSAPGGAGLGDRARGAAARRDTSHDRRQRRARAVALADRLNQLYGADRVTATADVERAMARATD